MGCGCQNQNDQVEDFCPDAGATDPVAEVTTKQSIGRRTPCRLRYGNQSIDLQTQPGHEYSFGPQLIKLP